MAESNVYLYINGEKTLLGKLRDGTEAAVTAALSDSIISTSTTEAASSLAVKTLNDKIEEAKSSHASVGIIITAGDGLTGGGTLAEDITVSADIASPEDIIQKTPKKLLDATHYAELKDRIPLEATTTVPGTVVLSDAAALADGTPKCVVDAAQLKVVDDSLVTTVDIPADAPHPGEKAFSVPAGQASAIRCIENLGVFWFSPTSTDLVDGQNVLLPEGFTDADSGRWVRISPDMNSILAEILPFMDQTQTLLQAMHVVPTIRYVEAEAYRGQLSAYGGFYDQDIYLAGVKLGDVAFVSLQTTGASYITTTAYIRKNNYVTVRYVNSNNTVQYSTNSSTKITVCTMSF